MTNNLLVIFYSENIVREDLMASLDQAEVEAEQSCVIVPKLL